jgi:lipopolysaccharide/colanic/teichoic acid biosynthesis glycosyltransferase
MKEMLLPRYLNKYTRQDSTFPWLEGIASRLRDILFSFFGLLVLSPLFVLIAIAIKRDSPGPVFFRGSRLGKNGKAFKILKFRTMYERPESYQGPKITAGDDPRRTPVGMWLRDTKLNELPQLWNVFVGEMSLVGPRPEDPQIAAKWPGEERQEILSLAPGITSPATVMYRDEEDLLKTESVLDDYYETVMPNKLRLDRIYVRNRSFWMDLDILFWTVLVLIPRIEAVRPPEDLIFWGPIAKAFGRYLNWFSIDTIASFFAFSIASVFFRTFGPFHVGWTRMLGLSIGFALLFSFSGYLMGIQRIYWSKASGDEVVFLAPPVALATILALVINMLIDILPYNLLIMASAMAGFGFVALRYRSRLITGFAKLLLSRWDTPTFARERLLIIGGGDAGQVVAWMVANNLGQSNFRVVGFVDDDLYKQGARIRGVNVIGSRQDIPRLVNQHDVGIIVYAIHNIPAEEREEILTICRQAAVPVVAMPDFMGRLRTVSSILADIQSVNGIVNSEKI